MSYVPIVIVLDDEEEQEESSLWKVKRRNWPRVKENIVRDAEERGYKNPYFNDLTLRYERDYPFSFLGWAAVAFFLWFGVFFYIMGQYDYWSWRYPIDPFSLSIVASLAISAVPVLIYCGATDLEVDWLSIDEAKNHMLIEVFGSKIWRAKYFEEIGLEHPAVGKTETVVCGYCDTEYPRTQGRCPVCGGKPKPR